MDACLHRWTGRASSRDSSQNALPILYLCLFQQSVPRGAQVGWEESSREGSQRLGGDRKQEAMLARWLQEGNRRLRERLTSTATRQSDPGPTPSGRPGQGDAKVASYSAAL